MAINLRDLAKKATVFAEIMDGRDKADTEDIIKYHNDGITIRDFEPVTMKDEDGEENDFFVYVADELPQKFMFSGHVLNKIFQQVIAMADGDIEEARAEFKRQGLKVKLGSKQTKDKKKSVTTVEVL